MKLHKSAYLVLGMIAAGYATGYEISKQAALTSRFFWAAGDGQVYPQLRRLTELGLIEGQRESRGEREKNVYRLTDPGRLALHEWLTSTAAPMWELRDEGLLKLFFAGELSTEQLLERIEVIRRAHEGAIERLQEIETVARDHPAALLTQRFGLALHTAAVEWCDQIADELRDADPDGRAAAALRAVLQPGVDA